MLRKIRFITLLTLLIAHQAAADGGKITIISDFYANCGLAIGLYDKENKLLAKNDYLSTKSFQRVLFIYQPQRWDLAIDSFIVIKTLYPAMIRPGCGGPIIKHVYQIPWVADTDICFMVNAQTIQPCDVNLIMDAPARLIARYPPRRENYWTPPQSAYFRGGYR